MSCTWRPDEERLGEVAELFTTDDDGDDAEVPSAADGTMPGSSAGDTASATRDA